MKSTAVLWKLIASIALVALFLLAAAGSDEGSTPSSSSTSPTNSPGTSVKEAPIVFDNGEEDDVAPVEEIDFSNEDDDEY